MSTTEKLVKLSEIARTKTFPGQSRDRLVTAVVDGAGRLRSLSIAQLDRSRTAAALLAKDVVDAVTAAAGVAAAEVNVRAARILGTTPDDLDRRLAELGQQALRALADTNREPDPDTTRELAGGIGHVTCDSGGGLVAVALAEDVLHRMNEKTLAARLTAAITQAQQEG